MHSMQVRSGAYVFNVHHNGDFSGDVVVNGPSASMNMALHHQTHTIEVTIPFEVIERMVAEKKRRELVERLEGRKDALLEVNRTASVAYLDRAIETWEQMSVEGLLYG